MIKLYIKKIYYLFLILTPVVFCSCVRAPIINSNSKPQTTEAFDILSINNTYLYECTILDGSFNVIRMLPGGSVCQVFNDGSWISADGSSLVMRSSEGERLWEIKGNYHHQIREDNEGNLLLLTTDITINNEKKIRSDVVEKRTRTGALIAKWHLKDHVNELAIYHHKQANRPLFWSNPSDPFNEGLEFELSHINSIQSIPISQRPKFNNASYLIFDPILNACIGLDRDLKKISWGLDLPNGDKPYSAKHDCQITEDGNLLYYDNHAISQKNCSSYAVFLRELNGNILFQHPTGDSGTEDCHFTDSKGGVEKTNDHYLLSVSSGKNSFIGLINSSGQWVQKKTLDHEIQEIKRIPFPDFLLKNKVH